MKPTLFIGSSKEARDLNIPQAFQQSLASVASCVPWWEAPGFKQNGSFSTLDALVEATNEFDFALLILTPDDVVRSRRSQLAGPRDNVLLELGLFLGALAPSRIFIAVKESKPKVKMPSDLDGMQAPRFGWFEGEATRSQGEISSVCNGFSAQIQKLAHRVVHLQIAHEWWFDTKERKLNVELSAAKLALERPRIGNWKLCIAARIQDRLVNSEDDEHMIFSTTRALPSSLSDNLLFQIEEKRFPRKVNAGDRVEAHVLVVPPSSKIEDKWTLKVAVTNRCRKVESMTLQLGAQRSNKSSKRTTLRRGHMKRKK